MFLGFHDNLRLAVLINFVLIKKKCILMSMVHISFVVSAFPYWSYYIVPAVCVTLLLSCVSCPIPTRGSWWWLTLYTEDCTQEYDIVYTIVTPYLPVPDHLYLGCWYPRSVVLHNSVNTRAVHSIHSLLLGIAHMGLKPVAPQNLIGQVGGPGLGIQLALFNHPIRL